VNLQRIDAKAGLLFGTLALTALLNACSTPKVGAPCLPEQVPETGFDDREAYIESSSVQCETRVCIVYHLKGDPRDNCDRNAPTMQCDPAKDPKCQPMKQCADPNEVTGRIYCTCRCDAKGSGFGECQCPDGYSCEDVLEQGGPGVRGGYCVKNGT
jgi:hypothetical protein